MVNCASSTSREQGHSGHRQADRAINLRKEPNMLTRRSLIAAIPAGVACSAMTTEAHAQVSPGQATAIAKEAFIYGYPMVVNYGTMFEFAIDKNQSQYKAPINQLRNLTHVATPQDTAIVTPNSDTPYSMIWADLRAEPLVLGVPQVENARYYSLQFIDLYTYNFAYVGSRTTGNGAGRFLLAGPDWKGEVPKGITKLIRADTQLVFVIYRTQLFSPEDLGNVEKVQAGYSVQTLSQFLGTPAPPAAAKVDFPPFSREKAMSAEFFTYLNFVLQFCPTVPGDETARANFEKIGIAPGKRFDPAAFSPEVRLAVAAGMAEGIKTIDAKVATETGTKSLFGTREFMKNNYLNRAVGAKMGIYGNSEDEAYYFTWHGDTSGKPLDGAANRYLLRFAKGEQPPVNAFWSVTMYNGKTQLLVSNRLNRYLINSPMLPNLKLDPDGSLPIYIQKDSPGGDKEANWLPANDGPIFLVLRCYWPKQAVLDGQWKLPPITQLS
jgi:hypothetical protein